MRLLSWNDGSKSNTALIFGEGLIGATVAEVLAQRVGSPGTRYSYCWTSAKYRHRTLALISEEIFRDSGESTREQRVAIVWAAGKSSFASSKEQMLQEQGLVAELLDFGRLLTRDHSHLRVSIHLVSSAGGLFEGQRHVTSSTIPHPKRPYGAGKLVQEHLVKAACNDLPDQFFSMIYRPSSVYGFHKNGRLGLVATLLRNGMARHVTRVAGRIDTVRDYVYVLDVADLIAKRVIGFSPQCFMPLLLCSGRPSSIGEIIQEVSEILDRRPLLQFDIAPGNTESISFLKTSLPRDLHQTDLLTGIRITSNRVQAISQIQGT